MTMRQPTFFLSHGGGPWPWLEGNHRRAFAWLEASLQALPGLVPERPRAVLAVSGHWEEPGFAVSTAAWPGMVYDYYGFPEHTYHIRYPAPGSPELAARVIALTGAAGLPVTADPDRGFDHGTFSMMQPIYPEADVPVVSLSLRADFDPAAHLALGRALAPLRDEGVLIVGSGFSFHNLRLFNAAGTEASAGFDAWLRHSLIDLPADARAKALRGWDAAPYARTAHAREDHLLPLMVAVGAAGEDAATCVYSEYAMGGAIAASSYGFGLSVADSPFDRLGAVAA
jgi:aromatic ring-opening dioxygenase catalytic subunit (LigB family)